LALGTLVPWAMAFLGLSLVASDAGDNYWANRWAYELVGALLAYPVWLIAWMIFAFRSVRAGLNLRAIVLIAIAAAAIFAFNADKM